MDAKANDSAVAISILSPVKIDSLLCSYIFLRVGWTFKSFGKSVIFKPNSFNFFTGTAVFLITPNY
jgi:hypothetical protein